MWNGIVPTAKSAQESFQSVRAPVSHAGILLFGLETPEMGPETQQESRAVSGPCLQGHLWVWWGSPAVLGHHLLPIFHEATGREGWAWEWMNHSCGILLGFWIEKTRPIYKNPLSMVCPGSDLALEDTEQALEIFLVVKLGISAICGTSTGQRPGMLAYIPEWTGQPLPTQNYSVPNDQQKP